MAHGCEVPGPRGVLGRIREDTLVEVLTPVSGCQLADFPKTILPEMLADDGLNGIHVGKVQVQVFSIRKELGSVPRKMGTTGK